MQRDDRDSPVPAHDAPAASTNPALRASTGAAQDATPTRSATMRPARDWSGRALAIISLAVAMTGLAYNTWRNESTEAHRNIRQSCFIILEESAALQQLVQIRYYGSDRSTSTWVSAWGKAALIRDLGNLAPPRTGQEAQQVFDVWAKRAHEIDERNPLAQEDIEDAIERLRRQTLDDLRELD